MRPTPRRRRRVDRRALFARFAAPAAFLAAATVAILLVRSGLRADEERPATTATATATTPTGTATGPARTLPPRRFYRLRAGETLSDVAERFDTSVGRLLELNPDVDPLSLRVGQRIRVE